MKRFALFLAAVMISFGGRAKATDAVLVAPAATFAVPTVVGSVVTPTVVSPQAVALPQTVQVVPQTIALTPLAVLPRAVTRQPVRNCVRLFRR
jgi:hypothetical protein